MTERDNIGACSSYAQLARRILGETMSLQGGDDLHQGRKLIAHTIINADAKYGARRQQVASTRIYDRPIPRAYQPIYAQCVRAAEEALREQASGYDPTDDAVFIRLRPQGGATPQSE